MQLSRMDADQTEVLETANRKAVQPYSEWENDKYFLEMIDIWVNQFEAYRSARGIPIVAVFVPKGNVKPNYYEMRHPAHNDTIYYKVTSSGRCTIDTDLDHHLVDFKFLQEDIAFRRKHGYILHWSK